MKPSQDPPTTMMPVFSMLFAKCQEACDDGAKEPVPEPEYPSKSSGSNWDTKKRRIVLKDGDAILMNLL